MNIKSFRKYTPRPLITAGTKLALSFYQRIWPELSIREETTDAVVFRDNLLFNRIKIPLQNVKCIVDAGAYVGYQTLYFSKKFPHATIFAIEPEVSNYKQLIKHTSSVTNVVTINAAVWSTKELVSLKNRNTGNWGFTVTNEGDRDTKTVTLHEIIKQSPNGVIDVLKIDIEGAERELFLHKTEEWLPNVRMIIAELHDRIYPDCSKVVFSKLPSNEWEHYKQGEKDIFIRIT